MTVKEAAVVLGVNPWRVRDYCDKGQIITTRDARGNRVLDPDDVQRFRKERRAWVAPRRCLMCGTSIEQHQVFCDGEACRKRRQRQRYHKSHQGKAALTEADWKKGDT